MKEPVSELLTYYHVVMMHIRSHFHTDPDISYEAMCENYKHHKAYKKLLKIATPEDLKLIEHFLDHDIQVLLHNRDSTVFEQSPLFLALKEYFWSLLFESADQTQLRWYQMHHDIAEEGQYHEGEFVVSGRVECGHCGLIRSYEHLHELEACERCGNTHFERPRHFPRSIDLKSHHHF